MTESSEQGGIVALHRVTFRIAAAAAMLTSIVLAIALTDQARSAYPGDNDADDDDADFSPNGRLIVFESERGGGTDDLWRMKANGETERRLTNSDNLAEQVPDWRSK